VWEVTTGTTPLPTLYANDVVVGNQLFTVQILIELDPTINLWVDPFVTVHPLLDMTVDYQLGSFNVTNTYENEAWSYQKDPGETGTLYGGFEDDSDFAGLMVVGVRPNVQIQLWDGNGTENELQPDVDGIRLPTVQVSSTQAGNTIQGTVQGFEQTQIVGRVSLKTGVSSPSPVPLTSDRVARQVLDIPWNAFEDLVAQGFIAWVLGGVFDSIQDYTVANPDKRASQIVRTSTTSNLEEACN